jgi:hypothetical protein
VVEQAMNCNKNHFHKMGQKVSKWIGTAIAETTPNPNKVSHNWKHTPAIDIGKDMKLYTKLLKECQFKSSHNSVVGDVQIFGAASINCLALVLNNGVRAIELDMFESLDKKGTPVVSHGNREFNLQVTSAVDFEVCVKYIAEHAWLDTNEPLFIFLEINVVSNDTLREIEHICLEYLASRIFLPGSLTLANVSLGTLRNKCVIIPSTKQPLLRRISQELSLYGGSFHNMGSNDDAREPIGNELIRVYADNVFLSHNPNPLPFLRKRNHFVCMNWTFEDNGLYEYKHYFGNKGIL